MSIEYTAVDDIKMQKLNMVISKRYQEKDTKERHWIGYHLKEEEEEEGENKFAQERADKKELGNKDHLRAYRPTKTIKSIRRLYRTF